MKKMKNKTKQRNKEKTPKPYKLEGTRFELNIKKKKKVILSKYQFI